MALVVIPLLSEEGWTAKPDGVVTDEAARVKSQTQKSKATTPPLRGIPATGVGSKPSSAVAGGGAEADSPAPHWL